MLKIPSPIQLCLTFGAQGAQQQSSVAPPRLTHFPPTDCFIRFSGKQPVTLRPDRVFSENGLTPAIATVQDLPELVGMMHSATSELPRHSIENLGAVIARRSDEELVRYFSLFIPQDELPEGVNLRDILPHLKQQFSDPQAMARLLAVEKSDEEFDEKFTKTLRQRFIDNPDGALLILRNQEGEVVAMEGVNQFQETHDFHINQGIFDKIDPKHGLLSELYVKPDYRNKGIGTAMKKAIISYARDSLGYKYVWAPTERENRSHKMNLKLGYQPLTKKTRFQDSPAFTAKLNQRLIKEYNVGSMLLCWLDTSTIH